MLSIITVSYRDPVGLRQTFDSLEGWNRLGHEWQHVVVDSSPEANEEVLRQYYNRWNLLHKIEPPDGVYAAMNSGIKSASEDFFWFLNGGDTLACGASLLALLERLRGEPKASFAIGAAKLTRGGQPLYTRLPPRRLSDGLMGGNGICHQAILYRRRIFDDIGLFSLNYRLASDYEHHFRMLANGEKMIRFGEEIVCYDVGGRSGNFRDSIAEFKHVIKKNRRQLSAVWYFECRLRLLLLLAKNHLLGFFLSSPVLSRIPAGWYLLKGIIGRRKGI